MATEIKTLGSWARTRNVLVSTLIVHRQALLQTPFSELPGSDYVKFSQGVEKTLKNIEAHSIYALEIIDDEIAASGLIANISAAAVRARKEADRIKMATKRVNELAALVDQGTEIVGLFSGLVGL